MGLPRSTVFFGSFTCVSAKSKATRAGLAMAKLLGLMAGPSK
jgi:hypothetical protein